MTFRRGPVFKVYEAKQAKRHKLFTAGKDISVAETSWEAFKAEVAAVKPKRKRRGVPGRVVPNRGQWQHLHPPRIRCEYQKANGVQCGNWPIKGATRCKDHGGYRQAPASEATQAIYAKGKIDEADRRMKAHADLGRIDQVVLKAARSAIKERCNTRAVPSHILLEGCNLMMLDDGGVAWRRYLAGLPRFTRRETEDPVGGREGDMT